MNDPANTGKLSAMVAQLPPGAALEMAHHLLEECERHGDDPCTREQAAAHEAGHFIAGRALLGHVYPAIRIYRYEGRWLGRCTMPHGVDTTAYVQDASLFLGTAAQNVGGFAGEMAAGLAHETSSLDERLTAQFMGNAYAMTHHVPVETVHGVIGLLALQAILVNRPAFDDLRQRLCRDKRLSREPLAAAARRIRPVEIPTPERIRAAFPQVISK